MIATICHWLTGLRFPFRNFVRFLQSGQYHLPFGTLFKWRHFIWNHLTWQFGLSQAIIVPSSGPLQ